MNTVDCSMFDSKNYSPQTIALFSATSVGLMAALIGGWMSNSMVGALVILLIIFCFTFWVVRFLVEKFIHRQIKLIYKFINQTKANPMSSQ